VRTAVRFVPWISLLIAIAVVLGPPGQEVIRGLSSGEQLSRSISQAVIMVAGVVLVLLAVIELAVRIYFKRRAARAE
jgi:hypothetical protein